MNDSRTRSWVFFIVMIYSQGQYISPAIAQTPSNVDLDKVLNDAVVLHNYGTAKKPKLAALYLEHELYTIRLQAMSELRAMGLPEKFYLEYEAAEMTWDAEKVKAAVAPMKQWAEQAASSPDPVIDKHTRAELLPKVIGSWLHIVREYNQADDYARLFGRNFPDLIPKLRNDDERKAAFNWGVQFLDGDELFSEIGMPTDPDLGLEKREEIDQWLPRVGQWMAANNPYFYFHHKERTLKLDLAARAAGIPSKDYRMTHPWGPNEGPNLTDPHKKWDRAFREED